eukprot:Pompholyxophrys_punicea_v1_NODE_119_length_3359_cov_12.851998.p5 type:complete len:104 gc:universal NODE_119_length_3359_cov_12.851998:1342-1653(+)
MSSYGESNVKTLPFAGRREKWREWKVQVMAYALKKGFSRLLAKDFKIVTEEEFLLEDTTKEQKAEFMANAEGMSFLTLSCKGIAFAVVESTITEKKPHGPCDF